MSVEATPYDVGDWYTADTTPHLHLVDDIDIQQSVSRTVTQARDILVRGRVARYTIEIPGDWEEDEPAVVIVSGFCGLSSAYAKLRHAIAETSQRPAITIEQPRSSMSDYVRDLRPGNPRGRLQSDGLAGVLNDARETYGIELYALACHSAGGKTATDTVRQAMQSGSDLPTIENITFIATAGADGSNLKDLAFRAPNFFVGEFGHDLPDMARGFRDRPMASAREARHYYSNLPELAVEGIGASMYDLLPDLETLHDAKISTAALLPNLDRLFSTSRAMKRLSDVVDVCVEIEGDHNVPIVKPRETSLALQGIWQQLDH